MSMVALTWPPESDMWDSFTPYFTAYFFYQGAVQFVQSYYQGQRMYVKRTLGKATNMDVSQTETIDEFHGGIWLVVVLVFVAHVCQVAMGVMVLSRLNLSAPWYSFREEAQCAALGALFMVLGVVNFLVTFYTLLEKWATSHNRRKLGHRDGNERERGGGAPGGEIEVQQVAPGGDPSMTGEEGAGGAGAKPKMT